MKPFVTVLGICALLLASGTAYADTHNWNGDGDNCWWSNAVNWVEDTVPATTDDAVVNSRVEGGYWACLSQNECIANLTMGNASWLDTDGWTLTVTGTATFDSTNNSGDAGTFITLDNSSTTGNDPGYINCSTVVINGGTNGTLLTVTSSGGEQMTLQTGDYGTCP